MGFGKDNKGVILREGPVITLGTLAAVTVIKQTAGGIGSDLEEDFRILKTEYVAYLDGLTANEGPIILGIANNELSVSEIATALNMNGPLGRSDRLQQEQAERAVWVLGIFDTDSSAGKAIGDGQPQEFKPRWTFSDGDGWTWFAYNRGSGALTTGAVVRVTAKHFGVWVT